MTRVLLGTMMATALLLGAAPRSPADDCAPAGDSDACQMCGRHCNCGKTCKLVQGTRKVSKFCYSCKCEDICIPNPSTYCGKTCVQEKDPCTGCVKCVKKDNWTPAPCGRIITKHTLVKKEVTKEVPAYKWEVVNICCNCRQRCATENAAVPKDMIVNTPPLPVEDESPEVVQTSATQAVDSPAPAEQTRASSPAVSVKQKLMSLLGK